ncbi:MAG: Holliday junction resolvase RuvX [Actinomycetales bacterium]|nr:Holliday junction resolvase RuvX [Actinomycetales bacterium]
MTSPTDAGFRRGIRIGVDVGSVRVGVARTDPDGRLAVPVATLTRPAGRSGARSDLIALVDLVVEYEPLEVVVGLPLGLDGTEGRAAAAVRLYAVDLAATLRARGLGVPVRLLDERMTTAEATRGLQAAGHDARSGRSVIDQAAAVIIVQHALDTERATGMPPGTLLTPAEDPE